MGVPPEFGTKRVAAFRSGAAQGDEF